MANKRVHEQLKK